MGTVWFKPRSYRHFDVPVSEAFAAKVMDPNFVKRHPFSPLIHYNKEEIRYKYNSVEKKRIIVKKNRPIKYSSHRDSCVLSYYSWLINQKLERKYSELGLSESVIAYRSLGKANYEFSAEALAFAKEQSPVAILAFDVTGFFDNLDHQLLKSRLKEVLGVAELEEHWFKIFRYVTKFRYVDLEALKKHPDFGKRLKEKRTLRPIASLAELKVAKIAFWENPNPGKGIPQGTPISAALSNLYMIDFDRAARAFCESIDALYRRYSDDILVICKQELATTAEAEIAHLLKNEKLELSPSKTEHTNFSADAPHLCCGRPAQYLGFNLTERGATIRQSSLSRQWRKLRRAIKRTQKHGLKQIEAGKADRIWTKKLRRRFTPLQFKNFSSYGRRSAAAFGEDENITRQLKRFERAAEREIKRLENDVHGPSAHVT